MVKGCIRSIRYIKTSFCFVINIARRIFGSKSSRRHLVGPLGELTSAALYILVAKRGKSMVMGPEGKGWGEDRSGGESGFVKGAHLTKPGWSKYKPHTHSKPTNLALFRHKLTLYRFNQGLILLQGAQMEAGGGTPPAPSL